MLKLYPYHDEGRGRNTNAKQCQRRGDSSIAKTGDMSRIAG